MKSNPVKSPKFPVFVILFSLFIAGFLLAFLFLSCINESPSFTNASLIQYEYNQGSEFYSAVKLSYDSANMSSYANMVIKSGYLSICGRTDGSFMCTSRTDLRPLAQFKALELRTKGNSSIAATVDPLSMAKTFSNNIVNPYFIVIALFFCVIAFLSTMWTSCQSMPMRSAMQNASLISNILAWLFWTIGAIWFQVAGQATAYLVNDASMTVLKATVGSTASGMAWSAFAFLVISTILVVLLWRKQKKMEVEIAAENKV
ncbi:factor-induced gene 1 protein [Trichomonascus vanleenenianus]|uniref:Fig1p n=1 Tax=Trichomonascus vanleenenianus TaxID=2268995 RepID=UPI003ECB04D0